MIIRIMQTEDLEQVAELERRCFSEFWSYGILEAGICSPYDVYYVLIKEAHIIGYGNLRVLAGEAEIQRIAVLPEFRGLGAGRQLMDAMVGYARRQGAYAIGLEVRESNLVARKLYESYGFTGEAVRKAYYHNPQEDGLIMWLRQL